MSEPDLWVQRKCDLCSGEGTTAHLNRKWVRWALAQAGWNQAELARKTNFSTPYICDIIHGKRSVPAAVVTVLKERLKEE